MNEQTLFICPRCQQRAQRMPYTGDFEHKCHSNEVLQNEDVLVIGDFEEFNEPVVKVPSKAQQQFAGAENKLQGTRAGIEGDRDETKTSRGFPTSRFRTRQHFEMIPDNELKTKKTEEVGHDVETRN